MREGSPPPPVMCHMSRVMCQVSGVRGHVSHVTNVTCQIFFYKVVKLFGGGSFINGATLSSFLMVNDYFLDSYILECMVIVSP